MPKRLKPYFAEVTNYEEYSGSAAYTVQKYNMLDSSVLYLHGGLDGKELTEFLKVISRFLNERQNVKDYKCVKDIDYLLIKKVQERAKQLQQWSGYSSLNKFIYAHTDYVDFKDALDALFRAVKRIKISLINIQMFLVMEIYAYLTFFMTKIIN